MTKHPTVLMAYPSDMGHTSCMLFFGYITGWDHFEAQEVGFKELYQMFQLVTEQLGQDAIVLDADDLLKHPGKAQVKMPLLTQV